MIGSLFRHVNRHGQVSSRRISPQAVFEIVKTHAEDLGIEVCPHDLVAHLPS
jgi:hypothetical protein